MQGRAKVSTSRGVVVGSGDGAELYSDPLEKDGFLWMVFDATLTHPRRRYVFCRVFEQNGSGSHTLYEE